MDVGNVIHIALHSAETQLDSALNICSFAHQVFFPIGGLITLWLYSRLSPFSPSFSSPILQPPKALQVC